LADPDSGGEVDDGIDAVQGVLDGGAVADIPDDQLDV